MNRLKKLWEKIRRFFRKEVFDVDLLTIDYVKSLNRPGCKVLITFMAIALNKDEMPKRNVEALEKYPNATYVAICDEEDKVIESIWAKDVEDALFTLLSANKGNVVIECGSKEGSI